MNEKEYIKQVLICRRATEQIGSVKYNMLTKAIQWLETHTTEEKTTTDKVKNGKYAHTTIRWKDDGREEETIIAVDCPYIEKYDEEILFYCESEEEFERLKEYDNGEDFVVVGCTIFTDTL